MLILQPLKIIFDLPEAFLVGVGEIQTDEWMGHLLALGYVEGEWWFDIFFLAQIFRESLDNDE